MAVALAFMAMAACGEKPQAQESTETKSSYTRKPAKDGAGWRWRGNRDKCFYTFERRCYSTKKKACGSARCKMSECKAVGGMPARITCDKTRKRKR